MFLLRDHLFAWPEIAPFLKMANRFNNKINLKLRQLIIKKNRILFYLKNNTGYSERKSPHSEKHN